MNKILVVGIVILFIGLSIVSSTGKLGEVKPTCYSSLKYVNKSNGLLSCDHIAYIGSEQFIDCWIYESILNEGNLTCICDGSGSSFISGATCISDDKIMVTESGSGKLYEIDLENCELTSIGGGGVDLNGLAYDPHNEVLYGCSSDALYKIDPEDGSQEYIGDFGIVSPMVAVACDDNSSLYGWDVKFTDQSYLYKIDTETGEAIIVGGMGKTLCYAQDGDFCKIDDILYLAAYILIPEYGGYLCTCDKDTGELTILGQFPNNVQVTLFAIPWNSPPNTPIIDGPDSGKPGVEYEFCIIASDPDDDTLFVLWNWGDGTGSDWLGPLVSGQEVCDSHSWNETGTYNISVTIRDEYGEGVTAFKEVTIPRNKATSHLWYQWFLERFSLLEKLLNLLR